MASRKWHILQNLVIRNVSQTRGKRGWARASVGVVLCRCCGDVGKRYPANTGRSLNGGSLLGHRLRCRPDIDPPWGEPMQFFCPGEISRMHIYLVRLGIWAQSQTAARLLSLLIGREMPLNSLLRLPSSTNFAKWLEEIQRELRKLVVSGRAEGLHYAALCALPRQPGGPTRRWT